MATAETVDMTKAIPIPSTGVDIPQPVANGTKASADAFVNGASPEEVQAAGVAGTNVSPERLAQAIRPPSVDMTKAIPIPASAIPQAPGQFQGAAPALPDPSKEAEAARQKQLADDAAARSEAFKKDAYKRVWNDLKSKNMHDAANDVATLFHNPDERNPADLGIGVAKGAGQTVNAVSSAMNKLPIVGETLAPKVGVNAAEKMMTPEGTGQEIGVGVETLAEFMMGDEGLKALEGLSYAKKLKALLPYITQLEDNPRMLKLVHAAYNTAKMTALGAASGAAHAPEGERTQGAEEGALGGAIGGAAGEGIGAGIEALAKPGAEAAAGIKPGGGLLGLKPGTEEVAGSQIPVRAEGKAASVAEGAMSNAQKARLQELEVNQTQPAVRKAVSGVAAEAGGADAAATAGKADPLGFGGQAEGLRAKAKPSFEAVDTASDGAFSKAQKDADLARTALDFEGKKAYAAAIEKQNQIWDSVIAMADKGDTPEVAEQYRAAKTQWRRSVGMDELGARFNRSVHPAPADLVKANGGVDNGYINPKQFREGITDAIQNGEFEKAGFTPDHIQKIEDLGNVLERQQVKFTDSMTSLARLAKRFAGESGIGAGVGVLAHAAFPPALAVPAAAVAGEGIRWTAGEIASRIMSNPKAIEALTAGLKTGASADSIGVRLWNLLKSERGEAEIPFTGKMGTVGTEAGAKADTGFFKQAQAEKPNASLSEQIQHADKLKQEAKAGGGAVGAVKAAAPFADDAVAAATKASGPSTGYKYEPNPAKGNQEHTVTTTGPNGEKIGELSAQDTGNAKRGQVTVRSNQVYDPANRGKGIGKQHIETLIDEVSKNPDIKTVKSDISTTPDAQRVWKSIEAKYPHAVEMKMVGKGDSAKPVWTVDLDAIREDKAAGPVPQGAAPALPSPEMRTPGTRISQRNPTAVKSTENPVDENLLINRDAFNKADAVKPGYKSDLAELVSKYPGIKIDPTEARLNPDKALDKFTKHIADNLVWLHNQIPENIRNISKLWYDSAHELTKNWAADYGLQHEQMAGMVAALSPQNEWNNNIEVAKRVATIMRDHQNTPWEQEMETNAQRILAKQDPDADIHQVHQAVRGKQMSELNDPLEKAWWLRLYDESFNPRQHLNYAPDGSTRGYARTPVGQRLSTTKWSSLDAVAKAISIMEDGSKANISAKLGDAHKIRNFYNNIIDPWSKHGDVTIDTHAVGAGHLRPMGGSTPEVLDNFGGSPSSNVVGTQGTYGVYADAYRQAAARLGILPRELQSITWEGIRALYESAGKTDELKTKIAQIWKDHKNGEITIDRARKQILKDAGGFKRPKWAVESASQSSSGVAPKE